MVLMSTGKRITYILAAVMLFLFGGIGILLASKNSPTEPIDSYQTCMQSGGAILESYPEQCVTPDGSGTYPNPAQPID
jgi:hypothetical protein